MEVASPLSFGHVQAGSKRRFACSIDASMGVETGADDHQMDDNNMPYGHALKKRRFAGSNECFDMNDNPAPSPNFALSSAGNNNALGKRQRYSDSPKQPLNTHVSSSNVFMQKVVEKQNLEIQNLRNEKASMQLTIKSLSESQEKALHENKILKKAVTLQQQRQNQALSELESAKQYKDHAENKMKMLEQMVSSLRYHLQAQDSHVGNDFMGQRPPDVF